MKALTFSQISLGVRPCRANLNQKVEIFHLWLGRTNHVHWLRWNFAGPNGPRCPVATRNFMLIGTTSRPCENADLQPLGKTYTCHIMTILKGGNRFSIQRIVFPAGGTEKLGVNDRCAVFL